MTSLRTGLSSFLVVVCLGLGAAGGAACGGKTAGGGVPSGSSSGAGGGSSSGTASSSGGSSGGGSSGSSSGTSSGASSSGASSSGGSSGSSSGGGQCPGQMETGACSFAGECIYCEQGASFQCSCGDGAWACVGSEVACECPPNEPAPGTACSTTEQCAYTTMEGCGGDSCSCVNGGWSCAPLDCPPPPACPAQAPAESSQCPSVGQTCTYTVTNNCGQSQETCECDPSATWGCDVPVCSG